MISEKLQDNDGSNVGLGHAFTGDPRHLCHLIECFNTALGLPLAMFHPRLVNFILRPETAFHSYNDSLFRGPGSESDKRHDPPTFWTFAGYQRLVSRHHMVERVENDRTVDQCLTVVENQRRYSNQWIDARTSSGCCMTLSD